MNRRRFSTKWACGNAAGSQACFPFSTLGAVEKLARWEREANDRTDVMEGARLRRLFSRSDPCGVEGISEARIESTGNSVCCEAPRCGMEGSSFITRRGLVFSGTDATVLRFGSFGSGPEPVSEVRLLLLGDESCVGCAEWGARRGSCVREGESTAMLGGTGRCLSCSSPFRSDVASG